MFGLTAELENFTVNSQYLVWRRLPIVGGEGEGSVVSNTWWRAGRGSVIL